MARDAKAAIVAAISGFLYAYSTQISWAADLAGACCTDLEERIAELEATSLTKGNRKVLLKLSGHVNKMLLYWDDGINNDIYVTDGTQSETRFRLTGTAPIAAGWSAGFIIEMEVVGTKTNILDARTDGAPNENTDALVRHRKASFHVKNDRLGKIRIGRDSSATDDLLILNLAKNPIADPRPKWGSDFHLTRSQGTLGCTGAACRSSMNQDIITGNQDTRRTDVIGYDTPSLIGLVISAAWSEDDLADIAIRYKNEWNSIRLIAGIGYMWDTDEREATIGCPGPGLGAAGCVGERFDLERLVGSGSVMHVPSGAYLYGAFGRDSYGVSNSASHLNRSVFTAPVTGQKPETARMWYLQAGVKRRLLLPNLGTTTLYGEFQRGDDWGVRRDAGTLLGINAGLSEITDSSVDIIGFGLVQDIDAAAMQFYFGVRWFDREVRAATAGPAPIPNNAPAGADVSLEEFFTTALGARIKF
jgi:hypothetical protein